MRSLELKSSLTSLAILILLFAHNIQSLKIPHQNRADTPSVAACKEGCKGLNGAGGNDPDPGFKGQPNPMVVDKTCIKACEAEASSVAVVVPPPVPMPVIEPVPEPAPVQAPAPAPVQSSSAPAMTVYGAGSQSGPNIVSPIAPVLQAGNVELTKSEPISEVAPTVSSAPGPGTVTVVTMVNVTVFVTSGH